MHVRLTNCNEWIREHLLFGIYRPEDSAAVAAASEYFDRIERRLTDCGWQVTRDSRGYHEWNGRARSKDQDFGSLQTSEPLTPAQQADLEILVEAERSAAITANPPSDDWTLDEFAHRYNFNYLHVVSGTWPAGKEFLHDPDGWDDDGLCRMDFSEWDLLSRIGELSGKIDDAGRWQWDGLGNPTDEFGDSITSLTAGWRK